MTFQRTWDRFTKDWKNFAIMALGLLTGGLAASAVIAIVGGVAGVRALSVLPTLDLDYIESYLLDDPLFVMSMISKFLGMLILMMVVGVLVGGFVLGGLAGSVVAYRRGEPVSVALFWQMGKRWYVPMLGLSTVNALITLVLQVLDIIPVLGMIAAALCGAIVMVYCGIYASDLIISENHSVMDALGEAFKKMFGDYKEALRSGGIYLLMALVVGVVAGIFVLIPVLGAVICLAAAALFGVFVFYYFLERFESNASQPASEA